MLLLIYVFGNFFFNFFFTLQTKNSDFSFYKTMLFLDVPDIGGVLTNATWSLINYDFMAVPLFSILAGGYTIFSKDKACNESKIAVVSLSIVLSTIVFGYYYMHLYLLTINFVNPVPDTRYIAYSLPLSFIVVCIFLKSWFCEITKKLQCICFDGIRPYATYLLPLFRCVYRNSTFLLYSFLIFYLAANFSLNNTNSLKNIVEFDTRAVSLEGTVAIYPSYRNQFVYMYHNLYPQITLGSYKEIFEKSYDTLYILNRWGDPLFEPEISNLVLQQRFYNKANEEYEKANCIVTDNIEIYIYKKKDSSNRRKPSLIQA